jgi:hypothetical protein
MRLFYKIIAIVVLQITSINCEAQLSEIYHDAGMWNTININYRINKKYTALFTQELRLSENYSRLNLLYNNIGMQYTLNKKLKTNLVYRNIQKNIETNTISFRHRIMWDISFKQDINKFYLGYRHRLQAEVRDVRTSEIGRYPEIFSRNKFEIGYNINKDWTTWTGAEFRYQFTNVRDVIDDADWHRVRWMAGIDYQQNKIIKWSVYIVHQREFRTVTPTFLYITGLECNVNLNKALEKIAKKKKKNTKAETIIE